LEGIWDRIKNRNNTDSFNSSASLERDNVDSNLSDEYKDVTSHFTAVFIASAVKYDA
tara:strand:- start:3651 stop:3821 length:171 start_codon:yes stop_codon:yes gene_type:complete